MNYFYGFLVGFVLFSSCMSMELKEDQDIERQVLESKQQNKLAFLKVKCNDRMLEIAYDKVKHLPTLVDMLKDVDKDTELLLPSIPFTSNLLKLITEKLTLPLITGATFIAELRNLSFAELNENLEQLLKCLDFLGIDTPKIGNPWISSFRIAIDNVSIPEKTLSKSKSVQFYSLNETQERIMQNADDKTKHCLNCILKNEHMKKEMIDDIAIDEQFMYSISRNHLNVNLRIWEIFSAECRKVITQWGSHKHSICKILKIEGSKITCIIDGMEYEWNIKLFKDFDLFLKDIPFKYQFLLLLLHDAKTNGYKVDSVFRPMFRSFYDWMNSNYGRELAQEIYYTLDHYIPGVDCTLI